MLRLYFALTFGTVLAAAAPGVDFNREVRPILSDNCFHCHGPDSATRMANLRLDTEEGARKAIEAGNSAKSRLFVRVSHAKKPLRMPPPASGLSLTDAQVDTLKRWIDEGAKWDEHWAYRAPKRPAPPVVNAKSWVKNPVDLFLLARLEREGLKPAKAAPRETLIRRLSFDLTGLPPTPEEVAAFVNDRATGAYERLVDRLLASPHYGERMAMEWLDLARYADTHGFHIDSHRDMWPWRDWLIRAFNRNQPFDQFTVEQIAGDLLPDATLDQKIASGFNRNHMINFEGGAIPEEYQTEYVVDRVDATATVWMGLTMGCARCHDHKYDPISQKDFYRFAAFFNTTSEEGLDGRYGNAKPFLPLPNEAQQQRLDAIDAKTEARRAELDDEVIELLLRRWQRERFDHVPASPVRGLRAWYELDGNLSDISGQFRHGRVLTGDIAFGAGSIRNGANFDSATVAEFPASALDVSRPFSVSVWVRAGRQQGQPILQQLELSSGGMKGFELALAKPRTLPRLRRGHPVEIRLLGGDPGRALIVRSRDYVFLQNDNHHLSVTGDGSGRAAGLRLFVDGKPVALDVVQDTLPEGFRVEAPLTIGAAKAGAPFKGRIDDLRFYDRPLGEGEVEQLAVRYPVEVVLATPGKRNRETAGALRDYYLKHEAPEQFREAYRELLALREERIDLVEEIPTVMVMDEAETPRDTYVLGRGDYTQKGEKVLPGVPAMLPPLPSGEKANRLTLARWLTSPEHPLTARVAVNRYWQMLFGFGIVKTSEDFGSQGEPPVHQELLDWLAVEFVESGWDVKGLIRLIVTSAAYQQQSQVTPELLERDPENRLLARGPRRRLPAEMVRDNALAASGLLVKTIGGPSVLPYQPPGLWEELAFGEAFTAQEYEQDHGDKLYRRAMYTFWKRTAPPASLVTFDAPDREKCTSRRAVTNTPLQALVTLNDPTYVEAARHLAARVLSDVSARNDDMRLRKAFQLVTARLPQAQELRVLRGALAHQVGAYQRDPEAARALLAVGEKPAEAAIEAPRLAAWTNICTILLNLDESVTKE
ncbi:MAG TPA: DUF1553 domain-containing protein [Bryobacteraceae bacterium]|nr:hypothetical protein [Bryobacterales bacterium]HRJ17791.1 DUF1553 domain-containing protein [Bryobacteraceae bacterium]